MCVAHRPLAQEVAVRKLNLNDMYTFGRRVNPLVNIKSDDFVGPHAFELWFARLALLDWIKDESPLLSTSRRAARALIDAIDLIVSRDVMQIIDVPKDMRFEWHADALTTTLGEMEHVFGHDMPDIAAYVVSQKGIYRTDDLIANADQQLTPAARNSLPEQACFDLRQAGKCLAYELPTAATFHLWRSVETVMKHLYAALTKQTFDEAGVASSWGAYIQALKKAGADAKVTVFLDHIRSEYRNPQTHPDAQITIDEAQQLFGVATSSIDQMMRAAIELQQDAAAEKVLQDILQETQKTG
jgi:hypothetical protein